ncbi:MAG: UDP-N-acetylmuramoyl-L-alanyl-D-glutamate--2,6-diaminopimelate ligase [Oscillospiraceae bacterium]|nr:UDP-N-acetylmuramoyl-L-alanyl-D-glutamate--2,6-diaminopimelate ligase [Oscillospiraceae bacterium]
MKLKKILEKIKILSYDGNLDVEISDVSYDSRRIVSNCVYVCLEGFNYDGHDFVSQAIKNGAKAVVAFKKINTDNKNITIIYVENTRKSLAYMSASFFLNPASELITIGVTGTNGKTTCSFMIRDILKNSGIKTAIIGTIGIIFEDKKIKIENTTPESYEIQKYFRMMVSKGYKCVVLEASSLGLKWNRLDAINFDYGIFTNFSSDHIGGDEHKDLDEYLTCKSMLFQRCKEGILNIDDENYKKILKNHTCKIKTFGFSKNADFVASNSHLLIKPKYYGVRFDLFGEKKLQVDVSVPGKFNVYNALAAIAVCCQFKEEIKDKIILKSLDEIKITGRAEFIDIPLDYDLFIDFAHNDISMKNILKTLREYKPRHLIVAFGSGGERPKVRRFEMGEAAGKLADFSVITSDNPRGEDIFNIIDDIRIGLEKTNNAYAVFPDRKNAIEYCMNIAQEGDIVVLAGKGHEDYQYTKNGKEPFEEKKIVYSILEGMRAN